MGSFAQNTPQLRVTGPPYQSQVLAEMGKGKLWEGATVNRAREGSGSVEAMQRRFQSGHHLVSQVAEIGPS